MTIREEDVEAIATEALPSWREDDDVREYLLSILTEEDSYQDSETLKVMLLPFAGDSEETVIKMMNRLKALIHPDEFLDNENQKQHNTMDQITPTLLGDLQPLSRSPQEEIKEVKASKETVTTGKGKKDRQSKRLERLQKKAQGKEITKTMHQENSEETTEDDASAWQQRQSEGKNWGGRGFGGRGEYAGKVNHIKSNIHLSNVTVSLPNGADLLQNTTMDITANHRYGLIGRNGVGKSTLLDRLACRMIPGMPDMRILLVQQQVEGSDKTPVEVLLEADVERTQLLAEEVELETALESGNASESEIEEIAERLSQVMVEWDAIGADSAESRANEILNGLQFTKDMLQEPTTNLSGGWRMRLALARALFVPCDLLLLDECTNHLDLHGLDWLIKYLTSDDSRTMIIVSHDRSFLDAVCTDIIRMDHMQLSHHVGNYSEYERQMAEKSARDAQILGASERQRAKAEAFVHKQQALANKKSADPNKQRQAKMIKEKKMERIGNYREDGKRYKNFSLKQLDESHVRLAQKVHIEIDEPVVKMNFPEPLWPPGIGPGDGIVRTEDFSFGYDTKRMILDDVTVEIRRGSKIALVGPNGAGKSTLVTLVTGDLNPADFNASGSFWRHANIRIGHVSQYTVEELEVYEDQTVVEYAEEKLRNGRASAEVIAKASGNVRQYLGAFGLGGKHALQKIGKLSGGERMRLCFATVLADEPHLLCLDESTNHVDIETLDSMSEALDEFGGSILMVSHNQSFLSGFCTELWILEDGRLTVNYSDTATFDEVFSEYRSAAVQTGSVTDKRQTQAMLSKKATKQSTGARQNTALL